MEGFSVGATVGGGFVVGVLVGYAVKKVLKLIAVVAGLFLAGLAYLEYQHIFNINWSKLDIASHNTLSTITNAMTQVQGLDSGTSHSAALALTNVGIPLTGSMSMGFAIGFMKG